MNQDLAGTTTRVPAQRRADTRTVVLVMATGATISLASWAVGNAYFAFILLAPLLSGIVVASLGRSWRPGAAAWAVGGLGILLIDWIMHNEDQLFHLVVTVVVVGLFLLGYAPAAAGRSIFARHSRKQPRQLS